MRGRHQDRIGLALAVPLVLAASAACASSGRGRAEAAASPSPSLSDTAGVAVYGGVAPRNRGRTARVSRVTRQDIERAGDMNLGAFIESRLAGVRVVQNRGDFAVFITGASFQGSTGALVMVDGTEGALGGLRLQDMATIEVLKDSAASIYGVRGANGVLGITTHKR